MKIDNPAEQKRDADVRKRRRTDAHPSSSMSFLFSTHMCTRLLLPHETVVWTSAVTTYTIKHRKLQVRFN